MTRSPILVIGRPWKSNARTSFYSLLVLAHNEQCKVYYDPKGICQLDNNRDLTNTSTNYVSICTKNYLALRLSNLVYIREIFTAGAENLKLYRQLIAPKSPGRWQEKKWIWL